jgi:hypothetical protein
MTVPMIFSAAKIPTTQAKFDMGRTTGELALAARME